MLEEATNKGIGVGDIAEVQNILYDVIAERVLHERESLPGDHLDQLRL